MHFNFSIYPESKRLLLFLSFLFTFYFIQAQPAPMLDWAKGFGAAFNEEGKSITLDLNGNVITTGYFGSPVVDLDPGPGTSTVASYGNTDIFISKLDVNGNFLWAKTFGGISDDEGWSVTTDAGGNIYTTGYFQGTVDFDPGPSVFNLTALAYKDIFICKLDPSGNLLWAKQFAGTSDEYGSCIKVDPSGNIYTTGYFAGTTDFDPGPGTFTLSSSFSMNVFVSKLDGSGNFVFAKQISSSFYAHGKAIAVDNSGRIWLTGAYNGIIDLDPGPSTYTFASNGMIDIFICKLDALGNFTWGTSLGAGGEDSGNSIAIDSNNDVYFTGSFRATVDFDPGPGIYNITSYLSTCDDAFALKLSSSGNFVWFNHFGGGGIDRGAGVDVDLAGNSYYTGFHQDYAFFPPFQLQSVPFSNSNEDIYVCKLNASGSVVWAKGFNGGADHGNSIVVEGSGNKVYTTGNFMNTVDFDPNFPVSNVVCGGSYDQFILKLGICPNPPPAPTNTSVSSPTSCAGSSIMLTATGTGTIAWYTQANAVVGQASGTGTNYFIPITGSPGTYSFFVEANTCVNSATRTLITFTVYPNPIITANNGTICSGQSFTILPSGANSYTIEDGNPIVTPTTSANYTIIGTNTAGCLSVNPATLSILVNPLPTISINSGVICSGDSFTLIPGGANTYTIDGGNTVVSPTSNISYNIVGTDTLGCVSALAATANITVNPLPQLAQVVTPTYVCIGQSATLSVSGALTYTWSPALPPNNVISPPYSVSYTVVGTDTNNCIGSSAIIVTVGLCTGIKDSESIQLFKIYPNPTKGTVFVISPDETDLILYSAQGKVLRETRITEGKTEIHLESFVNGMYFLRVDDRIYKIIKE